MTLSFFSFPPDIDKLAKFLNKPIYTIKDTGLTYRALNHYVSKGVIDGKNDKGWRRFNGIEVTWIYIILELRQFEISLKFIERLKSNLLVQGSIGTIDKAAIINRPFNIEICFAIKEKYDLYLVVFPDGSFTYQDSLNQKLWSIKQYRNQSSIIIPLANSIKRLLI